MPEADPAPAAPAHPLEQALRDRGFELLGPPAAARASSRQTLPARQLQAFDLAGRGRIHAAVPVQLSLRFGPDAELLEAVAAAPRPEDIAAVRLMLEDLFEGGRIEDPEQPPSGRPARAATHTLVRLADGRRVVRRKGFDAGGGSAGR
jgi:hypothetical protein